MIIIEHNARFRKERLEKEMKQHQESMRPAETGQKVWGEKWVRRREQQLREEKEGQELSDL